MYLKLDSLEICKNLFSLKRWFLTNDLGKYEKVTFSLGKGECEDGTIREISGVVFQKDNGIIKGINSFVEFGKVYRVKFYIKENKEVLFEGDELHNELFDGFGYINASLLDEIKICDVSILNKKILKLEK